MGQQFFMEGLNLNFQPQLRVLSEEQINEIHSAALSILRDTGVQVKAPPALELLRKAGLPD